MEEEGGTFFRIVIFLNLSIYFGYGDPSSEVTLLLHTTIHKEGGGIAQLGKSSTSQAGDTGLNPMGGLDSDHPMHE